MGPLEHAIHELASALEPTVGQHAAARAQHAHLRQQLARTLPLDATHGTFLTGPYVRGAATRPLHDVDLFCVLRRSDFDAGVTPRQAVNIVKEALRTVYDGRASAPKGRSIPIQFAGTGTGYAVIPAFDSSIGQDVAFAIPDVEADRWIRSSPRRHKVLWEAARDATGPALEPLTKVVLHWNRQQPAGARLRSFHLEAMTWRALRAPPPDLAEGLRALFEGLATQVKSSTQDPAGLGAPLDEGLSYGERQAAHTRLAACADTVAEAMADARRGSLPEAHARLRALFGAPYPAPA